MRYLPQSAQDFIERHPTFKVAAKGFGFLLSERMIKILVGFFVHAFLARHLGPEQFGKMSYVVKTVNIFFVFGTFGVDEMIIRHLMENKYGNEDILKTVLLLRLKMSLIGLVSLGVFLLVVQPENLGFQILVFLYGINIFFQAFNVNELLFHSKMDFAPLFWGSNVSYLSASGLRLLGIWLNQGISFFLATYLWGEVVLKFFILRKIKWKSVFSIGKYRPDFASLLSRESFPYFISAFFILLDQRLSFMFIEKYRTPVELGNYSVAVTLVDLWLFLPLAVCSAVYPTIVTAFNSNKETYKIRIQYLTDIMVWLALGFFAGVFLTSDLIIKLLYGVKYAEAPATMGWYALTTVPVFFNLARIKWMTLENRLKDWLWICSASLAFNTIGHLWAVPKWGAMGAIGSFLISQALANLLTTAFLPGARSSVIFFLKSLTFPARMLKKLVYQN